ncbi:type VII secretion protein EccB [Prauserella muralis]|uniref:Type VII secretion protein EccB n=1 Tax=Prauserella muralis TaxID=588067 RepID=A0A2V4BAW9_9PSEU|nr:type VII secretion protein EccB [Prauserella muralis]PXY32211.1 type VII secretion protein EccB [Prauserella muralis]TWE24128.1 type VII secretion protein EccB [Prauserella muralis]
MPSTPTTKSQVQAYQFVLRRMQSALVRKDSVMLHDPMRTHSRATIVGVVLSALAMLGFVIFGFFKPAPKAPDSGIVIGEQSGSVYVVAGNPKKLIPTFNLASARLMLMAQQGGGEGGAAQQQGGAVQAVEPEVVPDEQLKDIPRGRLQGIPNGPELLPNQDQLISTDWAVCDEIVMDETVPDELARQNATTETTVFAGNTNLGSQLSQEQALLVTADDGKTYLVYRQGPEPEDGSANAVRAEVDLSDEAVRQALELDPSDARHISTGLLNAIPAVGELKAPEIEGAGSATSGFNIDALPVGSVFRIPRTEGSDYYVVSRSGVQQVPQAVAELTRFKNTTTGAGGGIPAVNPDQLTNMPFVEPGSEEYLDVGYYPQSVPSVLSPRQHPVSCLGWTVVGEGASEAVRTAVYVRSVMPGPKNAQGQPQLVKIGTPGPDGWKIDYFHMRPGFAAAVRSATTAETFGKGSIQLISDRGMRYSVPNQATATALGLTDLRPAPESIIKLLPVGASLNTQDVMRTYDAIPVDPEGGTIVQEEGAAAAGGN